MATVTVDVTPYRTMPVAESIAALCDALRTGFEDRISLAASKTLVATEDGNQRTCFVKVYRLPGAVAGFVVLHAWADDLSTYLSAYDHVPEWVYAGETRPFADHTAWYRTSLGMSCVWHDRSSGVKGTTYTLAYAEGMLTTTGDAVSVSLGGPDVRASMSVSLPDTDLGGCYVEVHIASDARSDLDEPMAWLSWESGQMIYSLSVPNTSTVRFPTDEANRLMYTYLVTDPDVDGHTLTKRLQSDKLTPYPGAQRVVFTADSTPSALAPMTVNFVTDRAGSLVVGNGVPIQCRAGESKTLSVGASMATGGNLALAFEIDGVEVATKGVAFVPGGSVSWAYVAGMFVPGVPDAGSNQIYIYGDAPACIYDRTGVALPSGVGAADVRHGTQDVYLATLPQIGEIPASFKVTGNKDLLVVPDDPSLQSVAVPVAFRAGEVTVIGLTFGDGESDFTHWLADFTGYTPYIMIGVAVVAAIILIGVLKR